MSFFSFRTSSSRAAMFEVVEVDEVQGCLMDACNLATTNSQQVWVLISVMRWTEAYLETRTS